MGIEKKLIWEFVHALWVGSMLPMRKSLATDNNQ
jgi:hypothetical protein